MIVRKERSILDAMRARPLLTGAAMGTRLMPRGKVRKRILNPLRGAKFTSQAKRYHGEDLAAGADALLTNSFVGDHAIFQKRPYTIITDCADAVSEIPREARRQNGGSTFVLGSIGPTPLDGPEAYEDQAYTLVANGADAVLLETHDFAQAMRGLQALRRLSFPVLVSLWKWGSDPSGEARRLEDGGADAIGTNCGRGLDDVILATSAIAGSVSVPLIARPSAGVPGEGASIASPEEFAAAVPDFLDMGVRLIGGCCGTDARYVSALRAAIDAKQKGAT